MSQARFLCATSLFVSKTFHLSRFRKKQKMNDESRFDQLLEIANDMEDKLERIQSELKEERAFHKVYAAGATLVFLYGLMYGAWLCPK